MPDPQIDYDALARQHGGGAQATDPDGLRTWNRQLLTPTSSEGLSDEAIKKIATLVGLTAGGVLTGGAADAIAAPAVVARFLPTLLRVGGAMVGGAGGRVTGGALGGILSGTPPTATVGEDLKQGAVEGAEGELLPAAAGPVLRTSGRLLSGGGRMVGRAVGDLPGAPWLQRLASQAVRGGLAHALGLGPVGDTAAAYGPRVVEGVGGALEATGRAVDAPALGGPGTMSQRVESGLDWLKRRLMPSDVPTHAERLSGGAERYAGAKRAQAAQQAAAARGSGMAPDLGERASVTAAEPRPQAEPGEFPRWVAPDLPTPPPPPPMPTPEPLPASPSIDPLLRRSGTVFEAPAAGAEPYPSWQAGEPLKRAVGKRPVADPLLRRSGTMFEAPAAGAEPYPSWQAGEPSAPAPSTAAPRRVPRVPKAAAAAPAVEPVVESPPPAPAAEPVVESPPPAPASTGSWIDAARDQIGRAQAMGVEVDPALLDAVAEAERAKPAAAIRGPSRGTRGRFAKKD